MAQQKQEQDLNQLLKVRRDKLADLQANGKDPFQITKFNQTHHSMEVKSLYEAHEAELLKDRAEVDVTGLDEEQAKEAVKKDYEERREIMDASPIKAPAEPDLWIQTDDELSLPADGYLSTEQLSVHSLHGVQHEVTVFQVPEGK